MSKVIKSSHATNLEKKTIALRKIVQEHMIDLNQDEEDIFNESLENSIDEQLQIAMLEAEKIRNDAKIEWEQFQQRMNDEMISNQKRAEEMFKQAKENGYNEGFQNGIQEGQKQYETFIQEAREVVEASRKDYTEHIEKTEPVIIKLAIKVAEKIISKRLNENDEHWISIVKDVITEVREQDLVKLYVHPSWFELTLSHKDELSLLVPNCEQIYIYPDIHLNENGCVIETPYGRIDASVDSQLLEVKQTLLEKLKEFGGHEGS